MLRRGRGCKLLRVNEELTVAFRRERQLSFTTSFWLVSPMLNDFNVGG
jgi:hypothetical protein